MGDDQPPLMTRGEAAAYLDTHGVKMGMNALGKYATAGKGPVFIKGTHGNPRAVFYTKAALDEWIEKRELPKSKGGRPRRENDTRHILEELVPMVERMANGVATFEDGMRFTDCLERAKRALRSKANGAG